jgi:hypothetical protein
MLRNAPIISVEVASLDEGDGYMGLVASVTAGIGGCCSTRGILERVKVKLGGAETTFGPSLSRSVLVCLMSLG